MGPMCSFFSAVQQTNHQQQKNGQKSLILTAYHTELSDQQAENYGVYTFIIHLFLSTVFFGRYYRTNRHWTETGHIWKERM